MKPSPNCSIDPRDLKLTDRELTQTGLPNDATLAIVENQVRMLTSGTVLDKVVEKLKLADDPRIQRPGPGGIGAHVQPALAAVCGNDAGGGGDRRRALAVDNLAESLYGRARRQDVRRRRSAPPPKSPRSRR